MGAGPTCVPGPVQGTVPMGAGPTYPVQGTIPMGAGPTCVPGPVQGTIPMGAGSTCVPGPVQGTIPMRGRGPPVNLAQFKVPFL